MRIGLDIDNVVAYFDKSIFEESLIYDKKLRNTGIVNPDAEHIVKGMFDWNKEETETFFCYNMERIAEGLNPCKDARKYMKQLLEEGHELYLLSHRAAPHYEHPYEVTIEWLKKNDIPYTKLVLTKKIDKSPECREYQIDIMFDDSVRNCTLLHDAGINAYVMETKYNLTPHPTLPSVSNFREIYQIVSNPIRKPAHVILDTDMNNEADDQFALAYLLHAKDKMILDAVTIAPYSHIGENNILENNQKSKMVTERIFELCHVDMTDKIYVGSNGYLEQGYEEETDAILKMLEVIQKNEMTYILAIGAITNVGILLKKHPELKEKIKVIWLGGHGLMCLSNDEYNLRQDPEALRIVLNSGADVTIIPCRNVASNLRTSIYELEHYLNIKEGLGKYLYDRFLNDGRHGITKRRVIWDISVIAYVINPDWFEVRTVVAPTIDEELQYRVIGNQHSIQFAIYLGADEIFEDMFTRLTGKKEISCD